MQRWIETKVDLKPSTKARYEGILRGNVLPQWRDVRLADVTHAVRDGRMARTPPTMPRCLGPGSARRTF